MVFCVHAGTERLSSRQTALRRTPVVVLAGPRQCGKTILARQFLTPESVNHFDLESPPSLARLDEAYV